ncbi:hypothetical protein [Actinosynnema sp. NPDC020468]|uniref:hypothetical protein n=1 Tax=Actinosynnema sp. NPDC020468 TaxID=3154488 RepID=UPI0033E74904
MANEQARRRIRVSVEIVVEIEDPAALHEAAVAHLDQAEHFGDPAHEAEARARDRADLGSDPVAALHLLLDPAGLLDRIPGATAVDAGFTLAELDDDGQPPAPRAD